jgi:putative nucleotidyltransferase with HDIG domain
VSAAYRVRQFVQAVGAWIRPLDIEQAWAGPCLPARAQQLFRAMPRHDQQHALKVFHSLQREGHTEPDLIAAALLHDVGKTPPQGGRLRLWHRVAVVLMHTFWPGLLERIGRDRPGSWRRPFYVQEHHAEIGAELAQQAGCSPITVELIRRHEGVPEPENKLLAALRAADGVN